MALHYCSLHGRLWSFTQQCWLPFPQDTMQAIHAYAALLRTITPDASALPIVEIGCDACAATIQQIAQIRGEADNQYAGEKG